MDRRRLERRLLLLGPVRRRGVHPRRGAEDLVRPRRRRLHVEELRRRPGHPEVQQGRGGQRHRHRLVRARREGGHGGLQGARSALRRALHRRAAGDAVRGDAPQGGARGLPAAPGAPGTLLQQAPLRPLQVQQGLHRRGHRRLYRGGDGELHQEPLRTPPGRHRGVQVVGAHRNERVRRDQRGPREADHHRRVQARVVRRARDALQLGPGPPEVQASRSLPALLPELQQASSAHRPAAGPGGPDRAVVGHRRLRDALAGLHLRPDP
mmetsp:Transcript_20929/g.62405  ORF Transcript_20929/g.62405 Transcript_20929/m.62405 type:complete len:266 (+) Transcript_20929:403-1200(+)